MYQFYFCVFVFPFCWLYIFSQPCMGQAGMMGMMSGARGASGGMMGMQGGMSGGGRGLMGQTKLPPGYANIHGEIMDITNKLVQRIIPGGTNYYSFQNQNGAPVFKRREVDSGRRFVLFPDINFPPGDGHYVVLRKMAGVNIPGMIPQALYEAFQLSLGDSIHGYVTEFNNQQYAAQANSRGGSGIPGVPNPYGAATSGYAAASMGMGAGRMKRKSQGIGNDDEQMLTNLIHSEDVAVDDHSKENKKRSETSVVTLQNLNVNQISYLESTSNFRFIGN